MSFSEEFAKDYINIKSKYDLVAYCYRYLMQGVPNQNIFLGEYIEVNDEAPMINPNLEMLSRLSVKIKNMLQQNPFLEWYSDLKEKELLDLVTGTEDHLIPYGEDFMNAATIPFFILRGLNLHFQDCSYETGEVAPLNKSYTKFCLVYVSSSSSIMDPIMDKMNYAEKIHSNDIRKYFKYIIILKTSELPQGYGIPRLITLQKDEEAFEKIIMADKIKIALIPGMQKRWFEFSVERGASFEVQYDEQKIEMIKDRIISLLNWAIDCKVNIIVFPEYICSKEIQRAIADNLSKINSFEPERLQELLFVVAGSSWTCDSNNVSCLYSYDGFLLGRVYKYSAYDNTINGNKYMERLQDPGKEITLIKIPQIGIFQTEICRNVSENGLFLRLAQVFDTQFLLIAAWSSSINRGFKKQIDAVISRNYRTCAAICNCCAAFSDSEDFRSDIGIVAVPQKGGSVVEGRYVYVRREKQQCDMCCEKGCIFEICYDFNGTEEENVLITSEFRQKP